MRALINGEYVTIPDDTLPPVPPTDAERIAELERLLYDKI